MEFRKELEVLINKHGMEQRSDTPDFILAEYLQGCLQVFDKAVVRREQWYGHEATFTKTGEVQSGKEVSQKASSD